MPTPNQIRWEKEKEIDRLLKDPLFHKDCHWVLDDIARRTVSDPSYSISAKKLYEQRFQVNLKLSRIEPEEIKKDITDVIAKTKKELKKAYDRPSHVDFSVFRLSFRENTKSTGIRMKFAKIRRPERLDPAIVEEPSNREAVNFWRQLIDLKIVKQVLLIYDAPDIGPQGLGQGLWSGSGDVGAVFHAEEILFHLKKPIEVLRWRDMRASDVTGSNQCLVLIGDSAHEWLNDRLRTRKDWLVRQSFYFERHGTPEGDGAIRDRRVNETTAKRGLYEHKRDSNSSSETGYALIFSYRCHEYTQVLFGIMGTSSAATRAAAQCMSRDDYVQEFRRFLSEQTGLASNSRPWAAEILIKISLLDGIFKGVTILDAVVYDT